MPVALSVMTEHATSAERKADELYDQAGKQLLDHCGDAPVLPDICNALWQHPLTGAKLFVGGIAAATNRDHLNELGVGHIVDCASSRSGACKTNRGFKHLSFPVASHAAVCVCDDTGDCDTEGESESGDYFSDMKTRYQPAEPESALSVFIPLFDWVDDALNSGSSVLLHCLAGAHRAGTVGVAYLMHAAQFNLPTALEEARQHRPMIDPFDKLLALLQGLDLGLQARSNRGI